MTLIQGLLLALIYFLANSTLIGVGFFTLLRPLVAGFFGGLILGDPVLGTQIGAALNVMYMGTMSAGGTLSSDSTLATLLAVSLGITQGIDLNAAMAVAVPVGILGTFLWFGRLTLGTFFVPLADKYAANGDADKIWIANVLLPQSMLFLISFVPAFIILYLGPDQIQGLLGFLGKNVLGSLIIVGKMLPALGLGLTLNSIYEGHAKVYLFVGFLLVQYFGLDSISLGFIAVILSIMYIQFTSDSKEEKTKRPISETTALPEKSGLITKRDLVRSSLIWGFHAQGVYNYERMQGIGFLHAMTPAFKKLYADDKEEMTKALERHTGFFNTAPQFAAMIPGLIVAMEEQKYMGADIDESAITSVKTSLMGPLSGIGDTVSQGILIPLLLSFFIGMSADGNILGPILYTIIMTVVVLGMNHISYFFGYNKGSEAILNLLESGLINKFIDAAKVMGTIVIGGLIASYVTVQTGITATFGETVFNLQTDVFDIILPGMVGLLLTLGCYKLINKGVGTTKVMFLLMLIGVIGGLTGILA